MVSNIYIWSGCNNVNNDVYVQRKEQITSSKKRHDSENESTKHVKSYGSSNPFEIYSYPEVKVGKKILKNRVHLGLWAGVQGGGE